jgi:hypothetical protein
MPVILGGIVIAVVVALGAAVVLRSVQRPVYESQPMPTVRVGEPGNNLVGPNWSGSASEGSRRTQEAHGGGRQQ